MWTAGTVRGMSTPTFSDARPRLGEPVSALETPVVTANLAVVERNLARYADLAADNDVALRVHTKAHKIPELARRQQARAPDGILCQKLGEAEVMVRDGIDDILLVCPVVSESKVERLCWVAERCDRFAVLADGPGNVDPLAAVAARRDQTIEVVMEVDAGLGRMGVPPGDEAVAFADHVRDLDGVVLRGLLGHDAHLPFLADDEADLEALCAETAADLAATADRLADEAGVEDPTVITGASATAPYMARQPGVTELDPGRYVFNDVDTLLRAPHVEQSDCALTARTTVISTPTADRAICDAGSKTISYVGSPDPAPVGRDDIAFVGRSSEHGHLDISEASDISVGDRLEFIVPNAYGPINIHELLPAVRDGHVEELWNVEARGKDK